MRLGLKGANNEQNRPNLEELQQRKIFWSTIGSGLCLAKEGNYGTGDQIWNRLSSSCLKWLCHPTSVVLDIVGVSLSKATHIQYTILQEF